MFRFQLINKPSKIKLKISVFVHTFYSVKFNLFGLSLFLYELSISRTF